MILEKLKRMEDFTHQEQAVARYILDHVEEIQQMSTEELARVSYTSKATVVRLCKKLEVEGYQELKLKLVSEMVQNIRVNQLLSKEPITEKSTFPDIIHTLPKLYDKAITDTELCMDRNVMIRICNRIKAADRIDIYGSGISYILAQSAAFKFATLGMECERQRSLSVRGKKEENGVLRYHIYRGQQEHDRNRPVFEGDDGDVRRGNRRPSQRGDPQMVPRDRGNPLQGLPAQLKGDHLLYGHHLCPGYLLFHAPGPDV